MGREFELTNTGVGLFIDGGGRGFELGRESGDKAGPFVGRAGRKFEFAEANCEKSKDTVGIVMSLDQTEYIYILAEFLCNCLSEFFVRLVYSIPRAVIFSVAFTF